MAAWKTQADLDGIRAVSLPRGAYAESDEVQVWNYGSTSAGGDGISANSTAVAVAKIEQQADQENSNSQNAEIRLRWRPG